MKRSSMLAAIFAVIGSMVIVWELLRRAVERYRNLYVRSANVQERQKSCSVCADNPTMTLSKFFVVVCFLNFTSCFYKFRFYICCDRCQDWFHGRCVGILQTEADNIDEYICPNCQGNSSINYANMKELSQKDFEGLKKLIKQIQVLGILLLFFFLY